MNNTQKLKTLFNRRKKIVLQLETIDEQVNIEFAYFIDSNLIPNPLWTPKPNNSPFALELLLSDIDLQSLKPWEIKNGYCFYSIILIPGINQIWGHKVIYTGNGNEIQSKVYKNIFNYEKGKYSNIHDSAFFFDFIKLFHSKKKIVIDSKEWN